MCNVQTGAAMSIIDYHDQLNIVVLKNILTVKRSLYYQQVMHKSRQSTGWPTPGLQRKRT